MTSKSIMVGLAIGRIVHYVLHDDSVNNGEHRPAIILNIHDKFEGVVNLTVFTDYHNDYPVTQMFSAHQGLSGVLWVTSIRYSEDKEPGTWHWQD